MRKSLLLGVIAVVASGSPLFAADLPVKAGPIPPAVFSWTGFYIGGDVGTRSNRSELASDQGTQTTTGVPGGGTIPFFDNIGINLSTTDFRGGGFLGYNYQFGNIVTGVEGTVGYASKQSVQAGAQLLALSPGFVTVNSTWDATVRGRLGYLVAPNVLLFAAGGAAWQHMDANLVCGAAVNCGLVGAQNAIFTPGSISGSSNRLGWTVGGGLEVEITSHWLLRGEYRYADFGSISFPGSTSVNIPFGTIPPTTLSISRTGVETFTLQTHTATFGAAYKF